MDWQSWGLALGVFAALQACVYYDAKDKCGPHMVYSAEAHVCLCDEGSVLDGGGCKPCGDGRVPLENACVCPGGTEESESGACEPVAGLGDACDGPDACKHPVYSYCAITAGASAGTCTNPCASDDDCAADQTCADWEPTPYCTSFASAGLTCSAPGLGDPLCGADADYCFMGQCFVRACTVTEDHATDDCPKDRKCCDVSFLGLPDAQTACVLLSSELCQ
jgi:hypothetical protein